ncbi:hypothetical protein [Metaclostridioides mangenotii]|uniref:hypothetical protein n=1 Tax=Metaclostridioides mangenotii TaxID=1540 RepID=UPI00047F25C8|nr:hypothetical protein [Clostridioides mangenotii]
MNIFFDIKLILKRRRVIFSALIAIILATLNLFWIGNDMIWTKSITGFEYFAYLNSGDGIVGIIYPLFISLVVGDLFIKEKRSSVLSYKITRLNSNDYIKKKVYSVGASSFIYMFFIQIIILVISLIIFKTGIPLRSQKNIYFCTEMLYNNPFVYCLVLILNSSLMASFMGVFTVFLSIIFKRLYAALILPYIIFMGITEFLTGFPLWIGGDLGQVFFKYAPLNMTGQYISSLNVMTLEPTIYWIILTIIFYKLSIYYFDKKLKNETLFL